MHNAAVYLLSSRKKLLPICLKKLFENWNYKYQYPVFVYFFKNTYNKNFINNIRNKISNKIEFIEIDYEFPKNISANELFFNRKYNRYVKEQFPKKRQGYLHMEHFVTNITSFGKIGCVSKELEKYDYLMRIDDDSNFYSKINFDLFNSMNNSVFSTGYTWNNFSWRQECTRENLWNFYKEYLNEKKILPKNKILLQAIQNNDEMQMHKLKWSAGNLNIYNMKFFKNDTNWLHYLDKLNKFAGDYKYRWGDIETIGLFYYTFFEEPIYDYDLINKKLYLNKFNNELSSTAPSTNFSLNVHNFFLLRYFYKLKRIFNNK